MVVIVQICKANAHPRVTPLEMGVVSSLCFKARLSVKPIDIKMIFLVSRN